MFPPAAGAVKVCATELSPLNGELLPTLADEVPVWAVVEIAVVPELVQPVRPLSNPPLLIPLDAVTVRLTEVLWFALAAVPVTVTVYVPGAVLAPTPNVSVELPPALIGFGLKDGVTPEGNPLALSVTLSAAALVTVVEIVAVLLPPRAAGTLLGLALIEKSEAVTVSVTEVLWFALAPVPVTVTEYVPGAVVAPTLRVSIELPPALIGFGVKDAVTPGGNPVALSVTLWAAPRESVVEGDGVVLPPCAAVTMHGLAPIEKSEGVTVSETVVLWLALAPVPVTVTVYVPGAVVAPTPRVSVELPPALIGFGLKDGVTPEGYPLALSVTLWATPLMTVVEIVEVVLPPWAAETLLGLALIEKSEGGGGSEEGRVGKGGRSRWS